MMTTASPHIRWNWKIPVVLTVITLPLYLTFRSISFDDFDSYSFALALDHYSLIHQQPQPPGFPVYIALARLLEGLLRNPIQALTTLSALSGSLSVVLVYLIGLRLDPRHPYTGTYAALLYGLVPVTWLTSEKALSDVPGMLGVLLALWLWLVWRGHTARQHEGGRAPIAAALVTGLALGIRPQNALPLMLLIGGFLVEDISCRRAVRPWIVAGGLGAVGVLLWLIPTAVVTGGLLPYLEQIGGHATHVGRADSLIGMQGPLPAILRARLLALVDTLLTSLIGTGIYPPLARGTTWRLLTLAAVVLPGLLVADRRSRTTRWLAVWALVVTVQVLLFETLDRPRLLLPILPPLALLTASGWARIGPRAIRSGALALTALIMLVQTVPWATTLARMPSPPSQAAAYIRAHYPPEETVIAAAGSFRAAQVELPGYPLIYLYRFDAETLASALAADRHYVVILDRDQFTTEAIDVLTQQATWVTIEDLTFARDRRVHTQHDQVRMQVVAPPDRVPPATLLLPASGCIDVGAAEDGHYLGQGWFRPEEVGGVTGRWAGQTVTTTVRFSLPTQGPYVLRLRALAYPEAQQVTAWINDTRLESLDQPQTWTEMEIVLPASLPAGDIITLDLVHDRLASPAKATNGASSDTRQLSTAYDWLCISPAVETDSP